ncbi:hypothetical protein PIIN_02393 [Serendipita indica DSM 11827]|uniref:DUF6535 domain-containing protein n=1 Tax=Serendipita indica (strain DSM 11827) TaxID=1109443 RepID=G4TB36_SERID|nr:hypothetical protein PIIN_02393 [Serendipita indica DSM 11827]
MSRPPATQIEAHSLSHKLGSAKPALYLIHDDVIYAERFNHGIYPNDELDWNVDIWDAYNARSEIEDADFLDETLSSMDVLLVFAGLLSAILTAFIIETYKILQPDRSGVSSPNEFTPPQYAVRVNAFFFASLFTALLSALAAMLLKQWISYYTQGLKRISSKQIRARTRQFRYEAIRRWKLRGLVMLVPSILHLSLFLFFLGLVDLLFFINKKVFGIATALVICTGVFYMFTNLAPLVSESAPFHSPLAEGLRGVAGQVKRLNIYSPHELAVAKDVEKAGDETVENPADLIFRHGEPQALMIRRTPTLDVDVVVQLMEGADKTTEEYLIDHCFEKLMTFKFMARENPSTFFRPSIPRIFHQMSGTCLTKDRQKLLQSRVQHATLLCRFLDWYLTLRRTTAQEEWLRHLFSEIALPQLLHDHCVANQDIVGMLRGQTAHCRLQHLLEPGGGSCSACLSQTSVMFQYFENVPDKIFDDASFNAADDASLLDAINRYLLCLTECIAHSTQLGKVDRAGPELVDTTRMAKKIISKTGANPTFYRAISTHLSRQNYVNNPLAEMWKTALLDAIKKSVRLDIFSPDGERLTFREHPRVIHIPPSVQSVPFQIRQPRDWQKADNYVDAEIIRRNNHILSSNDP